MFSGSVGAGFVLALPFHHGDLEPDCVGVSTRKRGGGKCEVRGIAKHRTRGGQMLPMLAVGCRASALRVEEAGCFCEVHVAGVSIVAAGGPHLR